MGVRVHVTQRCFMRIIFYTSYNKMNYFEDVFQFFLGCTMSVIQKGNASLRRSLKYFIKDDWQES